jgi:hypothetical protein
MIVVADELNVSARLSCGLALVAYMKTAEVLGLSQDLARCLEPSHKVGPFGGYVQATDNPRELANAIRREQMQYLPGDWRTDKEKEEEAQALKRANAAAGQRAQKRKARPAAPASVDEWREQPAPRSAASSRAPSRSASPARAGPLWANVAGSREDTEVVVTSPGVPGIADWVSQVDLDDPLQVDRYLDESERMFKGTDNVDMDSNYDDANENM